MERKRESEEGAFDMIGGCIEGGFIKSYKEIKSRDKLRD